MKLIVGLGNPGIRYETTRHNAGYLMVDQLADVFGAEFNSWKGIGLLARANIYDKDTLLFKPGSFMNKSGLPVASVFNFFKINISDLVVIHDDIDVPPLKVKMRLAGSCGGHNGVRDIIEYLGTDAFYRIKLGVGKPEEKDFVMNDWVLGRLPDEYLEALSKEMLEATLVRIQELWKKLD